MVKLQISPCTTKGLKATEVCSNTSAELAKLRRTVARSDFAPCKRPMRNVFESKSVIGHASSVSPIETKMKLATSTDVLKTRGFKRDPELQYVLESSVTVWLASALEPKARTTTALTPEKKTSLL